MQFRWVGFWRAVIAVALHGCLGLLLLESSRADEPAWQWQQSDTRLALCNGEKVVWQLVADPKQPKVYFHPLASVDGDVLTNFRPADHPWHHGLWWSWKFINGLNYWEEDPKTHQSEGVTELTAVEFTPSDDFSASAELSISYHPPGEAAVMTERRVLSVTRPDADGRYRIDWTSKFTAGSADVDLGRTPLPHQPGGKSYGGYAGLSLRLVQQAGDWSVTTSDGPSAFTDAHGKAFRWVDFSSAGPGVAMFDHPQNLRHPSPWYLHNKSPMSFFSPSPLFNEPLVLKAGQTVDFQYRVLIHSKPMTADEIDAACRAFVSPEIP